LLTVLLQSLLLASAGLLSFGSMMLVILLLVSERSWHKGLAYALGYFSAYASMGVVVVTLGYRATADRRSEPGLFLPVLLMGLGTLLLWLALRNWRKPPTENSQPPRFFTLVSNITPPKAFALGALVTVINFKNLALFLTALSVIILSTLSLPEKIFVALLNALVFCLSVFIPVLIYLTLPHRARDLLNNLKTALERHNRPIGIWAPLLFGLLILLKGITSLP